MTSKQSQLHRHDAHMFDTYILTLNPCLQNGSGSPLNHIHLAVRRFPEDNPAKMLMVNEGDLVEQLCPLVDFVAAIGLVFFMEDGNSLTLPGRITRKQLVECNFPTEDLDRLDSRFRVGNYSYGAWN